MTEIKPKEQGNISVRYLPQTRRPTRSACASCAPALDATGNVNVTEPRLGGSSGRNRPSPPQPSPAPRPGAYGVNRRPVAIGKVGKRDPGVDAHLVPGGLVRPSHDAGKVDAGTRKDHVAKVVVRHSPRQLLRRRSKRKIDHGDLRALAKPPKAPSKTVICHKPQGRDHDFMQSQNNR